MNRFNRRQFLAAGLAGLALSRFAAAGEYPRDVQITRAVGFALPSKRSKFIGKNSRREPHGEFASDRMVRLYTNTGLEGLGNCSASKENVRQLLGKNPFDYYRSSETAMTGPLGVGTMPLWDLAGKALNKPVYELLGGKGPERVPVYDGSIYFADLLPQYENNWQDRFREELDMGREAGHTTFKIKVGRGAKWMPREEGDARDVEVVRILREHGGPDARLAVDANNGFDLEGAKKLFEQIGPYNIDFAEEMFPETVKDCLAFKEFLRASGWETLVADGETQSNLKALKPFMAAKAIEIYQADMNRFGFEGMLTEAAWAGEQGLRIAPHNWGSLIGYYMQLHVGRAIDNLYAAEHEPLSSEILQAEGYALRNGEATLPDAPGFGLVLDEDRFAAEIKPEFDWKL